ncbi:hypothetical protein [Marinicrinis lubricantis]|uniref:Uncharacterized protein n=1 Tax=Marinicrinis lubricantis TaxID=2086470 RepID=A0ABW1INK8_9BACL
MNTAEYQFSDLDQNPEAIQKIKLLEQQLAEQIGEPITLIAYTPRENDSSLGCRAGLDD